MRVLVALALCTSTVLAQPAPSGDKVDAKALLASGLKLYAAKDYLGALAVFKDAHVRFPSTKILLNIATTLKALGRNAEAANVYQRYLDAPDSDPAKQAGVIKVIAELDGKVGMLELAMTPAEAEVQLDDEEWQPAAAIKAYRVSPGKHVVRARLEGYEPTEKVFQAAASGIAELTLTLVAVPLPVSVGVASTDTPEGTTAIVATAERAPSRFGAFAFALLDIEHAGGAARVGASVEVLPRLQAELGAVIGPASGMYAGARYSVLAGRLRPQAAVGAPVFFSSGARVALRGAVALEIVLHPHVSLIAELGVERLLNAEMNYAETLFVPAIGAAGRL